MRRVRRRSRAGLCSAGPREQSTETQGSARSSARRVGTIPTATDDVALASAVAQPPWAILAWSMLRGAVLVLVAAAACGGRTPLGDGADSGFLECRYDPSVAPGDGPPSVRECEGTSYLLACSFKCPEDRTGTSTCTEFCPTNDPDPVMCVAHHGPLMPTTYACNELCNGNEYAADCRFRPDDVLAEPPAGCRDVQGYYCCPCL